MKGVILAGGRGTRLDPLTRVINKHLLPVYDRPMIYYPVRTLIEAGIDDIVVVTTPEDVGDFRRLLGNGHHLGVRRLHYACQERDGGIADALLHAEEFVGRSRMCVVLGDNIIESSIQHFVDEFEMQRSGARVLLKVVPDPEYFGVAQMDDGSIVEIVEKPQRPASCLAVIGIYFYDKDVFDLCRLVEPGAHGEMEITDVNNMYLRRGDLTHNVIDGWWTDAGTIESLYRANRLVAEGVSELAPILRYCA
ncbi:MAG: NTP transferase domain-containing protein [Planctomycetes bacterium]|nr:NTP transferase domain-containing protein [Planctomycetota bacterium]